MRPRALRQALLGLAAAASLLGAACEAPPPAEAPPAAPATHTLIDDLGHKVTLSGDPQRIVSLLPSLTEITCVIGACERLVAVDRFSTWPEAISQLPRVGGGLYETNHEAILATRPDLVLASQHGTAAETLRRAGLQVFQVKVDTWDDLWTGYTAVGKALGIEEDASRAAADLRRRLDTLAQESAGKTRPRVYFEVDPTPYAAGPPSFVGALIERAGGQNIVPAALGAYPRVSPELIVSAAPEVVIVTQREGSDARASLAERAGWATLPALTTGRVCVLSPEENDRVVRPGPRAAEGLRLLLDCIHRPPASAP